MIQLDSMKILILLVNNIPVVINFTDLAIIITHCYPELVHMRNKDGATPLKVLASKPSAFKSGSNLPWWKQILYYGKCCIRENDLIRFILFYKNGIKIQEWLNLP